MPTASLSLQDTPPCTELHVHTTCSDGMLSPVELVEKAATHGVQILAITDHDTTDAYTQAAATAAERGIELLSGVEVSCIERGRDVHLLGYCVDVQNAALQDLLRQIRASRIIRAEKIVEKLHQLGMSISVEDIAAKTKDNNIGRPHIAAVLVEQGYAQSYDEVFALYLYNGGPAYVAIDEHPVAEAMGIIHNAGGVAIVAHPSKTVRMREIIRFIDEGLDGIEVYHPSHTRQATNYLRNFARRYGIMATGGSDYHGSRPYDEFNFAHFSIDPAVIKKIKAGHVPRSVPPTLFSA